MLADTKGSAAHRKGEPPPTATRNKKRATEGHGPRTETPRAPHQRVAPEKKIKIIIIDNNYRNKESIDKDYDLLK